MEIKILGTGCPKCNKLSKLVEEIVQENDLAATVSKVTGLKEIAQAGVMLTPGLMIDNDVKFCGKVPSKSELARIITSNMSN